MKRSRTLPRRTKKVARALSAAVAAEAVAAFMDPALTPAQRTEALAAVKAKKQRGRKAKAK
jgi:hypothetical protein